MSEKFEQVASYYINKLWTKKQVRNAVGRWITEDEYKVITGEEYA